MPTGAARFNVGRQQAGMGWYQPGVSGALAILGPTIIGAAKGAQSGIYSGMAGAKGAPTAPKAEATTTMPPGSLGEMLSSAEATPPLMAAQEPDINTLLSDRGISPYRDPYIRYTPGGESPTTATGAGMTPRQRAMLNAVIRSQGGGGGYGYGANIFSSREFKRDITEASDQRSLLEVMNTPVYSYAYKNDGPGDPRRIGPMAEEVPRSWQTPDGHGIKMAPYWGALHAGVRALGREVQTLKERLRA